MKSASGSRRTQVLVTVVMGAGIAVAAVAWYATREAETPAAAVAAGASRTPGGAAGRRECIFQDGQRLGVDVTMTSDTALDLSVLGKGASGGGLHVHVAPPKKVQAEAAWHLELQAVQRRPDGSTVLAARIEKGPQKVTGLGSEDATSGDIRPIFLVRMDRNCALAEFARRDGVDLKGARSQQSMLATLQWRYPPAGKQARFETVERDANGWYKARNVLVETADETLLLRHHVGYERLFQGDASPAGRTSMKTGGAGLKVRPGAGPWFESLELDQTSELAMADVPVGEMKTRMVAKAGRARDTDLSVDPDDGTWIWGDLFEMEFPEVETSDADVLFGMKGIPFEDALVEYLRLLEDPNKNLRDYVNFLRDWVRVHPEGVPAILGAIRDKRFPADYGEPAVFFALSLADIPEARAGLLAVMGDGSFGTHNQARAALALADSSTLPGGYMGELLKQSRGDGSDSVADRDGVMSLTPMLGVVARTQRKLNPAAAAAAKAELMGRLEKETEPWRLAATLTGVGNIGDDSVLEPVKPFLTNADPRVREAAASALRHVSPNRAAGVYQPTLTAETDPQVRETLVRSYWNQSFSARLTPPEEVVGASVEALSTESNPDVLAAHIDLLGMAAQKGDGSARTALEGLLKAELAKRPWNLQLIQILGQFTGGAR